MEAGNGQYVLIDVRCEELRVGGRDVRCAVPHLPESFSPLMSAELAIFASVAT
jgi:hypothetical protein